jgi:ABC-type transport system involved in cytochrome c biogenesis ATPase subunit
MMRAGMSWDEVMKAYEKHQELENNSVMKSSEQAAAFVKWAYSNLSQKEANAAVEQLAFWTTMKAKPSQATLEEQLNKTKLTNKQKTAIWNSYGWKKESPWS